MNINCMTIDSQVCFHKWLFVDPVKLSWCIAEPVGQLGSTNQDSLGAKLLPMDVSAYPVVCVHPCYLLRAHHHCLWPNGREIRIGWLPHCCQLPSRSILWFVYIPVVCWEHGTTVCGLMVWRSVLVGYQTAANGCLSLSCDLCTSLSSAENTAPLSVMYQKYNVYNNGYTCENCTPFLYML